MNKPHLIRPAIILLAVFLAACGLLEIKLRNVTFQTNGVKPIPQQVVKYGDTADVPTEPTKHNYIFKGWCSNPELSIFYDFNSPVLNNLMLYAKWEPNDVNPKITQLHVTFHGENAYGYIDEHSTIPTISILLKKQQPFGTDSIPMTITHIETIPKQARTSKDVGDRIHTNKANKSTITVTSPKETKTRIYAVRLQYALKPTKVIAYNKTDTLGLAIRDSIMTSKDIVLTAWDLKPITSFRFSFANIRGTIHSDEYGVVRFTKRQLEKTSAVAGQYLYLIYRNDSIRLVPYHPHDIWDWRDLQGMRQDLNGSYRLMRDIALPNLGQQGMPEKGFFPVGLGIPRNPFTGNFDGQHHTLSNLAIKRKNKLTVGLFGRVEGRSSHVTLKNVHIRHREIEGQTLVGALVGTAYPATIYGVSVAPMSPGYIIRNFPVALGISSSVVPQTALGSVAGALLGSIYAHSTSTVTSTIPDTQDNRHLQSNTGGLVGLLVGGQAIGYATGDVNSINNHTSITTVIIACGGLVGRALPSSSTIGYATGNITIRDNTNRVAIAVDGIAVGGLVGLTSGAARGYATGRISFNNVVQWKEESRFGGNGVGGLVGVAGYLANLNTISLQGYTRGGIIWEGSPAISSNNIKITHVGMRIKTSCTGSCIGGVNGYYSGKNGESGLSVPYRTVGGSAGIDPISASSITVSPSTTQQDFNKLDFGSAIGQWVFTTGRWPAINLPPEVGGDFQPTNQPTRP